MEPFGEELVEALFEALPKLAALAGTALAGTALAPHLKKLHDQLSRLPNRREESKESNLDYPRSSSDQTPPIQRQQQTTYREEDKQYYSHNSSSTVQAFPIQRKEFLVLVVSALQADFIESLQAKGSIDSKDGESLYEITKYLGLGSKTELPKIKNDMSQYSVSKEEEESEYDIRLVYIELKQADEGFKPQVNQLDRYDAFRRLADLKVDLTISPRLQMEAYGNLGVYNR
ncbi:hypothetical protein [Microcoleus sp. FACHB-68]|uniref:hypothetical protein n=1 Tax=Microcoleus sp. FACHB-68 TaxID=2692826 RepID=UPI001682DDBC|nr:hypothetical protein [Microcoleus sp. FACHB-68]MBD1939597.1 hypothetical protein [Microcoleus sp. FACHB-68]